MRVMMIQHGTETIAVEDTFEAGLALCGYKQVAEWKQTDKWRTPSLAEYFRDCGVPVLGEGLTIVA